ncbi:MAG: peptidylprolyl isomerase [Planctomycetes bacterium]|nr:peptidylprolyl isomerase [Planctomycetota bacterium]
MPIDAEKDDLTKLRAQIETTHGSMNLEFLMDKAPNTVRNFAKLAGKGFYDGLAFHRIVKGFMIQGGCPKGDGTGGPGYNIKAEFNDTPHVKGVISMARAQNPDSAGCQFFICHGDARFLDKNYTAFGRIPDGDTESFATLDKIANVEVGASMGGERSKPKQRIGITKVTLSIAQ